jgi:hypothetical protein
VGVYGKFDGGEHVEVRVDRVVVECVEGLRPWGVVQVRVGWRVFSANISPLLYGSAGVTRKID